MIAALLLAMWAGSGIAADCDPSVVENRGINGLWIAMDWQHALCELDVGAGAATWEECLDAEGIYLPCRIYVKEWCDEPTICWSQEIYFCPILHQPVPLLRYFDEPADSLREVYAYVDGVLCGPPDGSNPVDVSPWPAVCVGSTLADFRACFE